MGRGQASIWEVWERVCPLTCIVAVFLQLPGTHDLIEFFRQIFTDEFPIAENAQALGVRAHGPLRGEVAVESEVRHEGLATRYCHGPSQDLTNVRVTVR